MLALSKLSTKVVAQPNMVLYFMELLLLKVLEMKNIFGSSRYIFFEGGVFHMLSLTA